MKKNLLILAVMSFVMTLGINSQTSVSEVWEFSVAKGNLPNYLTTAGNGARSAALGVVGGEKILVVPAREPASPNIIILNAADGANKGTLSMTGVSGGAVAVADAGVTEDGKILVSNVVINGANTSNRTFKIYRWDDITSNSTVAISYNTGGVGRYGDQITVTGKISDGTAAVYAANTITGTSTNGTTYNILKFSMIEDPANPGTYIFDSTPTVFSEAIVTPTVIPAGTAISNASVSPLPNGNFIYRARQSAIIELSPTGALTGNTIPISVVAEAVSPKYVDALSGNQYLGVYSDTYQAGVITIIKDNNWADAEIEVTTPAFGGATNSNTNRTGRFIVEKDGTNTYLYVLGSTRGIGKYSLTLEDVAAKVSDNSSEKINYKVSDNLLKFSNVKLNSIDVYSLNGQKIKSVINSSEINLSSLRGVYIIKVQKADGLSNTIKIML